MCVLIEQEMGLIFNMKYPSLKPTLFASEQIIMFLLLLSMAKAVKKDFLWLLKDLTIDEEGL